jgi:hypothetical protein
MGGLTDGHVFAGLPISDFAAARRWYETLLGEPIAFAGTPPQTW